MQLPFAGRDFIVNDCRAMLQVIMISVCTGRLQGHGGGIEQPPQIAPIGGMFLGTAIVPIGYGAA
jgi:hypothetical protein